MPQKPPKPRITLLSPQPANKPQHASLCERFSGWTRQQIHDLITHQDVPVGNMNMAGLGQFGMSQEMRKSQPDLNDFSGLLGGKKSTTSKMGFYKEEENDSSMYLPPNIPNMFPPHRPAEKDIMTSQSQSLSQFGLYGQSFGLPPQQQQQQQQQQQGGIPRGMPTPQPSQQQSQQQGFPSRSTGGHITPTSTGMPMQSGLPPHQPTSPNRGILPVGPRGMMNQVPSSTSQSSFNRAGVLGSGLHSPSSRTSPSLLAMQQKPQQHQRQMGGGSTTPTSMAGFGVQRQQSYTHQSTLLGNFNTQSLAGSFASAETIRTNPGSVPRWSAANDNAPALDMSDFPVLANRGRQTEAANSNMSMFQPNPMAGRPAYGKVASIDSVGPFSVGIVNTKPAEPAPEFTMQSEDFPALPGSSNKMDQSAMGIKEAPRFPGDKPNSNANNENNNHQNRGIRIHSDGKITNIPAGMVTDPFGMVGLLTFIRAAETDSNLVQLALGSDLTTLGLNLNSPENLYGTFQSPWADSPSRPQDIDFHVPVEYLTNLHIREKQLAPIKLSRYGEDLLFYLYYTHGGDVLQLAAAAELYNRDWRYHKDERVWITRGPGMEPQVKTSTYERGVYYYFDCHRWCKVAKEFHLDYDKLEERPHLPASFHHNVSTNPVIAH